MCPYPYPILKEYPSSLYPSLLAFGCTLPNIILGTPTAELSYRVLLQETVQAPFFVTHVTAAVVVLAF